MLSQKINMSYILLAVSVVLFAVGIIRSPVVTAQSAEAEAYCNSRQGPGAPAGAYEACLNLYAQEEAVCQALIIDSLIAECLAGIPDKLDEGSEPPDGPPIDEVEVDDRPMCENGELGTPVSFVTDDNDKCVEFDEESDDSLEENPIFVILGRVIQFLLASVGIALTAVIVLAGYQYITARGDPQKTASARNKIGFAITGVILFAFAGALMNWLVPGGIVTLG